MTIKDFFGMMPNNPDLNIEFKSATFKPFEFRHIEVHENKVIVYLNDYPDNK